MPTTLEDFLFLIHSEDSCLAFLLDVFHCYFYAAILNVGWRGAGEGFVCVEGAEQGLTFSFA